ncbi:SurA N-terminal domain-containing protein [Pigmentiphaga sp.]|uniref:SurA N-terminal domain-containing protein n=1 Tax=Pigmentiphaga sp. TaxID=1977564 RepID=UPI0026000ACF|nr:SurA N-terminal domain-containing protein [Pigmentiphaga sp.]MBX6317915.1 SurA N-terminal domain-containing protein [Pigmentiphaga sp.]
MFDLIRNHRRWMQFVLLLLILPSFVFVGIQGYSNFMERESALAKVAGESVTQQEFDAAVRGRLDQLRSMMGAQFDPQLFDTPAMRKAVLDEIINTRLIAAEASKNYFSASDDLLRTTIQAIPAVQENGRFSNARYRDALAAQGMTPVMFEAQLRRDLALQQVLGPVAQSAVVPEAVMDRLVAAATERREIQMLRFAAADYRAKVEVTDDDVKAYYEANRSRFQLPERVDAQYVVLDQNAVTPNISVSDEDIKAYYEQNQARYRQEEQRRASHILVAVESGASEAAREEARKKAQALAEQAKAPNADFAKLARENSQDPGSAGNGGDLDWFGRGMMVKPFEDAAFALKEGEVSEVVPTDYGFHIIKLTGVRPAVVKPLAEVRNEIVEEIKQQQAARRFAEAAEQFTNLVYEQSDTLEPAAQKFGLKIQEAQGIGRSGQPGNDVLGNPKVAQALFSEEVLQEKRNSGVIELAPNRLAAVRVTRHIPSTVQPLDEVAATIRQQLTDERAMGLAREEGEKRLKALREQDSTQGFGAPVTVARNAPQGVAPTVVDAVMKAPTDKLPAFVGTTTGDAYVIARVLKVEAAPKPEASVIAAEKSMMERRWAQAEQLAVLQMLREKYQVSVTADAQGASSSAAR